MTAAVINDRTDLARDVFISVDSTSLSGELIIPAAADGLVLFAHGSGSSRYSRRNQFVARVIREAGVGTLLFDLLGTGRASLRETTSDRARSNAPLRRAGCSGRSGAPRGR